MAEEKGRVKSKLSNIGADSSSQSQSSSQDIPCTPTKALDRGSESTSTEQTPSASNINESQDLFPSDSDSSILAAMEGSMSPESQTLAYSDSEQTQTDSQSHDVGTPIQSMTLFPDVDAVPRKQKSSSSTHKLFVKTPVVHGEVPSPSSSAFCDVWDENHVRMPCSAQNMYPVEGVSGKTEKRWMLIESALLTQMTSSYDIEEAILAYNSRFKGRWRFDILHETINDHMTQSQRDEFFKQVLPSMVQLTLSLPSAIPSAVPLLRTQSKQSLTFSQHQLACLLANAFFCTYPRRNASHKKSEYANFPSINMSGLFAPSGKRRQRDDAMVQKLKCLLHYFQRISQKMPTGCVTFKRKVIGELSSSEWLESSRKLTDCLFTSQGFIEDAERAAQVDFANCMVGGGALRTGCVQEEIQFMVHPELIVSRLFTEKLADNEVLVIKGAERFSDYTGYADDFTFDGAHTDRVAVDSLGRRYRHIIAMDATRFNNSASQYAITRVLREANKAYCGFHSNKSNPVAIATGNWGCGAFRGNLQLKALIQMLVAAQCNRQLYYSVFRDVKLKQELYAFHQFCTARDLTVGQLWNQIIEYDNQVVSKGRSFPGTPPNILQFVMKNLG